MKNYKGFDIPNIDEINQMQNDRCRQGLPILPTLTVQSGEGTVLCVPLSMEDLANIKTDDIDQFIYDHAVNTIDTYLSSK